MNELQTVLSDAGWLRFDSLHNAVLLALVPVLLGLRAMAARRNARALAQFSVSTAGRSSPGCADPVSVFGRAWLKPALVASGLTALVIASMQPRWGEMSEDLPRRGRDIVVLFDVSQSMLAQEAGRTRIDRAREAVGKLVQAVESAGGHRLSLVAFAGRASLLCPLTGDYDLFRDRLAAAGPEQAPRPGSHIGYAIGQALHGFGGLVRDYSDMVLLTDGEDHGSAPLNAARIASNLGVAVYTVGIGDAEHGTPVPSPASQDGETILAHNGSPVISRMDPDLLAKIARIANGAYLGIGVGEPTMVGFFRQHIASKPRRELSTVSSQVTQHRFQWFVGFAIVCLVLDMLLGGRVRTRAGSVSLPIPGPGLKTASVVIAIAALGLSGFRLWTTIADLVEDGNTAFAGGDYAGAEAAYEGAAAKLLEDEADSEAAQPAIEFNLGNARFKQYRYLDALDSYAQSADAKDTVVASRARYNLGNVKYQQALSAMQTFQDAVTPVREAVDWFRASLELDPAFEDARYNLELALELMRQLDRQNTAIAEESQASNRSSSTSYGQSTNVPSPAGGDKDQDSGKEPTEDDGEKPMDKAEKTDEKRNSASSGGASNTGSTPREMTREQAEELVNIVRDRTQAAETERQQWRRARMNDGDVAKAW